MSFDRALVQLMTGEINVINEVLFQHHVPAGVLPADAQITPTFLTYRISLGQGVRVGQVTSVEAQEPSLEELAEATYYLYSLIANKSLNLSTGTLVPGATHQIELDEKGNRVLKRKRYSAN